MERLFRIRRAGSRSWLDYQWSRAFGARLAARLEERCKGRKGVFLTLTYRREEYDGPRDLYKRASEEKHVAMFMRRLGRLLGGSLSGRWICKLEFQQGGWVHWHLLVLDIDRIEHSVLDDAWGHGFVWIKRLTAETRRYMTKYVAKGGGLPAFLYAEKPRSVKIIRTSPGFWGEESQPSDPPRPDRMPPLPAYRPIGESLRVQDAQTIVVEEGKYRCVKQPFRSILDRLMATGGRVVRRDGSWLEIEGGGLAEAGGASRGSAIRPPLHLRRKQNRDSERDPYSSGNWPEWVWQLFIEILDDRRALA